jgi:hypothetical protein
MARLIYQQDSTPQHRRMARRHIRLCGQINGAAAYGIAMQHPLDVLIAAENARHKAEEMCEDALDDFAMKDVLLDNQIRNLFEYAIRYDRDYLTQYATMLFPNQVFSEIINLPASEKLLKTAQLIEKLSTIDAANRLFPYIEALKKASESVHDAIEARRTANENLSRYHAEEEVARNYVRTSYEHNYLDARKQFGKLKSELLFPKVANKRGKSSNGAKKSDSEE